MHPAPGPCSPLVRKIRSLLLSRGLSLAELCRRSKELSPDPARFHIPHNLYDSIRRRRFRPSLGQIEALSLLTGYAFLDWISLFGFSLDEVARFQASFPAPRTVELDSRIYHRLTRLPRFEDLTALPLSGSIVPLSQCLRPAGAGPRDGSLRKSDTRYRYVKIGEKDSYAFPELVPGSIVRFGPLPVMPANLAAEQRPGKRLVLARHGRGLVCSKMNPAPTERIVLDSTDLPFAPVELENRIQVELLGFADVELRRTGRVEPPAVPRELGVPWVPDALRPPSPPGDAGRFIRTARLRCGLSFREASRRTRVIARLLGDPRYFCAPSSLSDYETCKVPPRQIQKMISICSVYFSSPAELLASAGFDLDRPGQLEMPAALVEEPGPGAPSRLQRARSERLGEIENRFGVLPYFLYRAMPAYFGKPDLSVRDLFWTGLERFAHPYLERAALLIVDRRKKWPRFCLNRPKWAQPIYLFLRREGGYLCGSGTVLDRVLLIYPSGAGMPALLRLRNQIDAEVVGEVIGVVRHLA